MTDAVPGDGIGKVGARRFVARVVEPVADNPVPTMAVAPILEARAAVINRIPVLDEIVPRAATLVGGRSVAATFKRNKDL